MAYRILVNGKWVLSNQEDNELVCQLSDFLSEYYGARYLDGSIPSFSEVMKIHNLAIMRWCERRHIKLSWIARPNEITALSIFSNNGMIRDCHLLVFETPNDVMLFKLHFNSDSRADD